MAAAAGSYTPALVALTSLFFMWGFITCLNDILIPHLKNVFELNYTQSVLIQFCFFGAYFIVSIPAGALVKRIGYKGGVVAGLMIAAIGCALFIPAASMRVYGFFLGALFVLASGITILQVAANPYVTVLGDPKTAPARLTLTQAFNSLGTTVAPMFGAMLILGGSDAAASAADGADAVRGPYMMLAGAFFVLAAIFALLKLPVIQEEAPAVRVHGQASIWSYRHLVLGAVAIFVYVGAEVSIGSFLINFMADPAIAGLPEASAAHYVTYFWGGAMVGRFIGAVVMRTIDGGKVLAFNAVIAGLLLAIAVLTTGPLSMWSVLAIGLFNSIMFPTIFSLALNGLGDRTSEGSGVLCLAIVGGALIPLAQGALADAIGVHHAFVLPIVCYIYIAYYGLKGCKPAA
ncbi:glucose/galactose MFS transporter [Rhizobium rhizosphaerae]|uniref:Glucose/galactose MFS transporter n=1 Tax=Xaviernesmea rhizosphaerae TaxID=1672749 RepID=A0A1Q9ANY1_9HYPH|nr:sugar MFS transporter [Xaviernesmea rhizosphaerae]OLP57149.1 glucose/galactose MFS transporter [Xaviernesmea rhizosphaerae]